jgi:tRNA(Glu) U13 pseudouridine synthase TruD
LSLSLNGVSTKNKLHFYLNSHLGKQAYDSKRVLLWHISKYYLNTIEVIRTICSVQSIVESRLWELTAFEVCYI